MMAQRRDHIMKEHSEIQRSLFLHAAEALGDQQNPHISDSLASDSVPGNPILYIYRQLTS